MKAGYTPARFFVGAWAIFLVGVVMFALVTAGNGRDGVPPGRV